MTMNNMLKELFDPIQAEEALKDKTKAYLAQATQGYTERKREARRYPRYAAACACLLLALVGGRWLYFTPTAQISIDINPSFEMDINRFDQVISVKDFNEDGRALAQGLDIKYKNYTAAIEEILNSDAVTTLLSADEVMTITVIGPDEQRSAEILTEVAGCTAAHRNTYCYYTPSEDVAPAHEMGFSCGKYRAFVELQRLDPGITPEEVQGMTMREIWDRIEALSPDGEETSSYGGWGYGHHGHGGGHRWE